MEPKKVLKTHTFIDMSIIYAPYMPIIVEEFRPRRGLSTRYAQRFVHNSFYGIVSVEPNTQNT